MATRRTRGTTLLTGLAALGLVLGLTGCEVHSSSFENEIGEASFRKECGPTRTQVSGVVMADEPYDVIIETNGVIRARKDDVTQHSGIVWTDAVNATQAQVTFVRSAGGGPDHLFTQQLPAC